MALRPLRHVVSDWEYPCTTLLCIFFFFGGGGGGYYPGSILEGSLVF